MKVDIHTAGTLARYRKKLESFTPISDEDFQHITEAIHEQQFNKGEVLLREGQVCKDYYFVLSGCIRSFGLENGREVNVKFFFEDDTACDFYSFRYEEPSQFYLVAMEDTVVYCATKTEALPVFQQGGASLQTLLFRFFQDLFLKEEEHSNNFKLLSPEERYNFLLEHRPQYLSRVPLIYLASYLGVSRETLTRIRKKIS
ncbi:MAG TPA: Crp/Fnr family transcriptional regulator [Parafilimonas sp.]|nr:Crp/Fnr family transcriptional regulator [Parafilimonas sp.]